MTSSRDCGRGHVGARAVARVGVAPPSCSSSCLRPEEVAVDRVVHVDAHAAVQVLLAAVAMREPASAAQNFADQTPRAWRGVTCDPSGQSGAPRRPAHRLEVDVGSPRQRCCTAWKEADAERRTARARARVAGGDLESRAPRRPPAVRRMATTERAGSRPTQCPSSADRARRRRAARPPSRRAPASGGRESGSPPVVRLRGGSTRMPVGPQGHEEDRAAFDRVRAAPGRVRPGFGGGHVTLLAPSRTKCRRRRDEAVVARHVEGRRSRASTSAAVSTRSRRRRARAASASRCSFGAEAARSAAGAVQRARAAQRQRRHRAPDLVAQDAELEEAHAHAALRLRHRDAQQVGGRRSRSHSVAVEAVARRPPAPSAARALASRREDLARELAERVLLFGEAGSPWLRPPARRREHQVMPSSGPPRLDQSTSTFMPTCTSSGAQPTTLARRSGACPLRDRSERSRSAGTRSRGTAGGGSR